VRAPVQRFAVGGARLDLPTSPIRRVHGFWVATGFAGRIDIQPWISNGLLVGTLWATCGAASLAIAPLTLWDPLAVTLDADYYPQVTPSCRSSAASRSSCTWRRSGDPLAGGCRRLLNCFNNHWFIREYSRVYGKAR